MRYPTNDERRASRALSPERVAILDVLRVYRRPMQPVEVATMLGRSRDQTKALLHNMVDVQTRQLRHPP